MERLLCPSKVSVREGIRRVIEQKEKRLGNAHHVLGQPEPADA
jgi:hypothetical protein